MKNAPPASASGTASIISAGVGQVVVGQIQDDEDQHDHRREDEPQRPGGPHLVLELAAPLDVHAFGQLHLLGDDPLGLVDEADDVAAADVERDVVQQPAVFALDHRRAFDDAHVGDGGRAGSSGSARARVGRRRRVHVAGAIGSTAAVAGRRRVDAVPAARRRHAAGLISSRRTLSSSSRLARA